MWFVMSCCRCQSFRDIHSPSRTVRRQRLSRILASGGPNRWANMTGLGPSSTSRGSTPSLVLRRANVAWFPIYGVPGISTTVRSETRSPSFSLRPRLDEGEKFPPEACGRSEGYTGATATFKLWHIMSLAWDLSSMYVVSRLPLCVGRAFK